MNSSDHKLKGFFHVFKGKHSSSKNSKRFDDEILNERNNRRPVERRESTRLETAAKILRRSLSKSKGINDDSSDISRNSVFYHSEGKGSRKRNGVLTSDRSQSFTGKSDFKKSLKKAQLMDKFGKSSNELDLYANLTFEATVSGAKSILLTEDNLKTLEPDLISDLPNDNESHSGALWPSSSSNQRRSSYTDSILELADSLISEDRSRDGSPDNYVTHIRTSSYYSLLREGPSSYPYISKSINVDAMMSGKPVCELELYARRYESRNGSSTTSRRRRNPESTTSSEKDEQLLRLNNNVSSVFTYLDPDKKCKVTDTTLRNIQKKALLEYYERHNSKYEIENKGFSRSVSQCSESWTAKKPNEDLPRSKSQNSILQFSENKENSISENESLTQKFSDEDALTTACDDSARPIYLAERANVFQKEAFDGELVYEGWKCRQEAERERLRRLEVRPHPPERPPKKPTLRLTSYRDENLPADSSISSSSSSSSSSRVPTPNSASSSKSSSRKPKFPSPPRPTEKSEEVPELSSRYPSERMIMEEESQLHGFKESSFSYSVSSSPSSPPSDSLANLTSSKRSLIIPARSSAGTSDGKGVEGWNKFLGGGAGGGVVTSTVIFTTEEVHKYKSSIKGGKVPPKPLPKPKIPTSSSSYFPIHTSKSSPNLNNNNNNKGFCGRKSWKNSLDSLPYSSSSVTQRDSVIHSHSHSDSGLSSLSGRTMSPISTVSSSGSSSGSSRASLRSSSIVSSSTIPLDEEEEKSSFSLNDFSGVTGEFVAVQPLNSSKSSGDEETSILETSSLLPLCNTKLQKKKEELVSRLSKKLDDLQRNLEDTKKERNRNEELGQRLTSQVSQFANPIEIDKFKLHVQEMEQITSLILGLSSRLAKVEKSLKSFYNGSSSHLGEPKGDLEGKRNKLLDQLEEAKKLKGNIDKRSDVINRILSKYLDKDVLNDYNLFIGRKVKLLVESKEIGERIYMVQEEKSAALSSSSNNNHHNNNNIS